MKKVSEYFGELTFNKTAMRNKLSQSAFEKMMATLEEGEPFDELIAADVAHALKEWAMDNGATHFSHWFQPQRLGTAEKHEAFICYDENHELIERFSAKHLIQSEPDASSFPSGGIRSTFEARGYTAWDPTSPAFLLESGRTRTLVIPSVYLSWTGDVLDLKTPFLRSQRALNDAVVHLQRLLGNRFAKRIKINLGLEQEYFLISKEAYESRADLKNCGRTLFGALPEKGQQMSDHYLGSIRKKVLHFMTELDSELYKRGIPAKTRHNEVAPNQFEIAPLFEEANLAIDHNLQMMEIIREIAEKNGMAALLQEKPFAGLNGSGKHMNWSFTDCTGANYLESSKSPLKNINFLMTVGAILLGVNEHGALLRASIADAGNDHRLGAHEAPPAIMSIYLGKYLSELLDHIEGLNKLTEKQIAHINLDIQKLPKVDKDVSDRNRTSPIAFTGNKFEFRAVGANQNCSEAATVFNLLATYGFKEICRRLEEKKGDIKLNTYVILKEILHETRRVRFEGNGYSQEWKEEAINRNLPFAENTPHALKFYLEDKAIKLFEESKVLNRTEIVSKVNIKIEMYNQLKNVEFRTVINMVNTCILPSILRYLNELSTTGNNLKNAGLTNKAINKEMEELNFLYESIYDLTATLRENMRNMKLIENVGEVSRIFSEEMETAYRKLRKMVDRAERMIADDQWLIIKYQKLLSEL